MYFLPRGWPQVKTRNLLEGDCELCSHCQPDRNGRKRATASDAGISRRPPHFGLFTAKREIGVYEPIMNIPDSNLKKQRISGFKGAISLIKVYQERDGWYTMGVVLRPTSLATLTLRLYWRGVSLIEFLRASIASKVFYVILVFLAFFLL